MSNTTETSEIRVSYNPSHHIWLNNGSYWVQFNTHLPDHSQRRVRQNLHTDHHGIARVLRDTILHEALSGRFLFGEPETA